MNKANYFLLGNLIMEARVTGGVDAPLPEFEGCKFTPSQSIRIVTALNRSDNRGWTEHKACVIQLTNKRREDLCPT